MWHKDEKQIIEGCCRKDRKAQKALYERYASVLLTANPGDTYQWYNNSTIITGATNQTYTATTSGAYTVAVTNVGGCSPLALAKHFNNYKVKQYFENG